MKFRRTYLSQQVADRLAAEIRNGVLREKLPDERKLAANLGVSRRTVRAALSILVRMKMLRTAGRQRMVADSPRGKAIKNGQRTVVFVTGNNAQSVQLFSRLEHYFVLSGYDLQMEVIPARANLRRWLGEISGQKRGSVWFLCSVAKKIQSWFERRGLPALIIGSRHEGIQLPDLNVDLRAICRHAAHTLLRLGHRRIIFLNPDSGLAGDLAGERGFNEVFSSLAGTSARGRILRHNDTPVQIGRLLKNLFSRAEAPTALIVSYPCYLVTVIGYLARMGKRIPEDVSIICMNYDPSFEYFVPFPSCYRIDFDRFARRAVQLAVGIDQGLSSSNSLLMMPRFVPGESLAPVQGIHP